MLTTTSNIISNRISDLETDFISENLNSSNRFIVDNIYNNNLLVNGDLTINSNLIVLGESTILETTVYTTEKLEVENNSTGVSLNIIQNDTFYDILNVSNSINEVFTIINNGNIGIGIAEPSNKLDVKGNINIDSYGNNYKYTIDGRDIILDTSNYISKTSNLISADLNNAIIDTSNHVDTTSNIISANLNNAIIDTSNHVDTTSNIISANLNNAIIDTSNHVDTTSNLYLQI